MTTYYEDRETAPAADRERALFARLPEALSRARQRASAIAQQLQGVETADIVDRAALAHIPVIRKSELLQTQLAQRAAADAEGMSVQQRVFGGFSAIGWGEAARVFASPGPIYEPESHRSDYWAFARALYAAGFRRGDLVYNCFSYHFTPAGSMMETAAHALGCTVFPGGVGQTEQQLQAMCDLRPAGYTGTPSFLRIIVEKAEEAGIKLDFLKRAMFSGEAFPPSLREWFRQRGIDGYQAYGTADLGMIAYETPAREGLVVNEDIVLEIVRPGTGDPVPHGEVGEVVVTTLNPDYPLIRFATGDLSAIMPGASPCGRTNLRIKGWMGRADQTTEIKGMFVRPEQVAAFVSRHEEVSRARVVATRESEKDVMTVFIETRAANPKLYENTLLDTLKLRGKVELVPPGSLPNDGKVIED